MVQGVDDAIEWARHATAEPAEPGQPRDEDEVCDIQVCVRDRLDALDLLGGMVA